MIAKPFTAQAEPTARQEQIVAFIREFTREHRFPPSVREICAGVGLSSTSTVQNHLDTLERKAVISRWGRRDRTVIVLEDWPA